MPSFLFSIFIILFLCYFDFVYIWQQFAIDRAIDGLQCDVVVIKVGNFVDGAASGVGKGSLGIDSTDGLLFVSDASGNWQAVTV